MNSNFNGEKLKSARQLRGLTVQQLGEAAKISKQSISQYENGDITPEAERIIALAEKLEVPPSFFFNGDTCKAETQTTYFRKLQSTSKAGRTMQKIRLEYIAKMYSALKQHINFPKLNIINMPIAIPGGLEKEVLESRTLEEVERIATALREYWGLGKDPIDDLELVVQTNGILLTGFDTKYDTIDAFSQKIDTSDGVVCIIAVDQGRRAECRINQDIAHEIGHLIMHPWDEDIESLSKDVFNAREDQAKKFAGAFLLPEETFREDIVKYPTDLGYYVYLKNKWKVSVQGMLKRAEQIKVLSQNQYQYLIRQVYKNGWREKEPGDEEVYSLKENLFQGAIDLLKSEKVLNETEILGLLATYGADFHYPETEQLLHLKEDTLKPVIEEKPPMVELRKEVNM